MTENEFKEKAIEILSDSNGYWNSDIGYCYKKWEEIKNADL